MINNFLDLVLRGELTHIILRGELTHIILSLVRL